MLLWKLYPSNESMDDLFCSLAVAWWVANTWKSRATIRGGEMLWRRISKFFCTMSYPEVKGEKNFHSSHKKKFKSHFRQKSCKDHDILFILFFFFLVFVCLFFFYHLASSCRSQGFILSLVKSQELF